MKKPIVDESVCEGHQICVGIAPEVFEIKENGKSHVHDPDGADKSDIQRAIESCPVDAISWKED